MRPRFGRHRGLALVASVAALLTGCSGPPPTPSSTPSATPASATPSASLPPRVTPQPSATEAACVPIEPAGTLPYVVLHRATEPDRNEVDGLDGYGAAAWHQPAPEWAIAVASGDWFLAGAHDNEYRPVCLDGVVVDAAPFSPLGLAPDPAALVRLAAVDPDGQARPSVAFAGPSSPGEWVVRVALTYGTGPDQRHQESFFRLRVDVPAPTVAGRATSPVACRRPGDHPPRAQLWVDGGAWIAGEGGSFTWGNIAGDAAQPVGPRVQAARAAQLSVRIAGDVCAAWWQIQLAPRPLILGDIQEPFLDLVPARPGYDDPGHANRFRLAPLPPGDWVVEATLEFANARGALIGQTTTFWKLVVR